MREMRDSGVAWIGSIPANWKLVRMKSLIAARDGGAWGEEAAGEDGDVICLRVADFDYQRYCFKSHGELTIRHYKPDVIERLHLIPGDILVEKSGGGEKTPVGRAVIFDKNYSALYANFIDRLRCKDGINPQWVLYNWANLYANNYTRPYTKQTTGIQNLDISALLSSQFIALPSDDEQEKILSVILTESKKVDALIANVQAQIEKLKAYKQSLITEVVTKGLDPNVPMKDSGFDWIGKIPEHWGIKKIKFNVSINTEKKSDLDLPYIALEHIEGFSGKRIETDSVYDVTGAIVAHRGEILFGKLRPYLAKVYIVEEESYVNSEFAVFSVITVNNQYLKWYMLSYGFLDTVNASTYGTKMPRANIDFIKNLYIPIFDVAEQEQIALFLDEKCDQIDRLIALKEAKIEKLEQYKKSLIYEYVTGKKEVH